MNPQQHNNNPQVLIDGYQQQQYHNPNNGVLFAGQNVGLRPQNNIIVTNNNKNNNKNKNPYY